MKTSVYPELSGRSAIAFKSVCYRALFYIVFISGVMQLVMLDAQFQGGVKFTELSFTEGLQTLFLVLSCLLLFYLWQVKRFLPTVSLLMQGFLLSSLIREQDYYLDLYLFDGAWQVLVVLVCIPCIGMVLYRRKAFLSEFNCYANSFSFGLFAAGFLTTYVFSRLYGRSSFWMELMELTYNRTIKNAAEEVTELFGYSLLLFAVIELVFWARRLSK